MVAATLLMVASADIIRKQDLFLGVDILAEATLLMAGWTTVSASDTLIGLENESVCVHRFSMVLLAFSA